MSRRRRGWVTIHTLMSNKTVSHKPLEVQGTKPVPWLSGDAPLVLSLTKAHLQAWTYTQSKLEEGILVSYQSDQEGSESPLQATEEEGAIRI
ncbi:hypothetical protein F2Q70_00028028 [Brassica cretica]|uniref:Uncharacterized protein n=1 Tax=Brassica cretica TaxID=69181 RepID=A0A8S9LBM4_BRACR|nr:hypothetical protein F2Q70_00028028 [Brassica cretica]